MSLITLQQVFKVYKQKHGVCIDQRVHKGLLEMQLISKRNVAAAA